jgi:hypothetical protein
LFNYLAPLCLPTSCKNTGTCEVSFNKIQCNCTDGFLGNECQYNKATFNFTDYVGIIKSYKNR